MDAVDNSLMQLAAFTDAHGLKDCYSNCLFTGLVSIELKGAISIHETKVCIVTGVGIEEGVVILEDLDPNDFPKYFHANWHDYVYSNESLIITGRHIRLGDYKIVIRVK